MTTTDRPDRDAVTEELVGFVTTDLGWDGDAVALPGLSLPEILDSQDLLELAGFVEDTFDVTIDDTEINADTFATLTAVAALVLAKTGAHAAP